MQRLLLPALLLGAGSAAAHDGHGALGPWHWHATDIFGFLLLALVAGLAWWWFSRGD